jgi:ABC-type branched-subunit amino acid transport system substrate-binding protein
MSETEKHEESKADEEKEKISGNLRIGVISSLTGPASYYGQSTMKGAEVAKDKLKEKYPNLSIELFHEDSFFTPKGGIDAYNKLKASNNINALVTMASNVSVAVRPVAATDNMLHIAASTLANNFSSPDDLSYRTTAKGEVEAKPALEFMANGKQRTHKSAAKRFKVTADGKILHRSHKLRHKRSVKSKRQAGYYCNTDARLDGACTCSDTGRSI